MIMCRHRIKVLRRLEHLSDTSEVCRHDRTALILYLLTFCLSGGHFERKLRGEFWHDEACSSLMATTTNLSQYFEAIKENVRIDHLADPSAVPTPAMVRIVLCQTVLVWRPISRHVE